MKNNRILLTGGSGMVGRNLLEHPGIWQYDVLAPSSSQLNLLDFQSVQKYLLEHQPAMVIHAAGKVGGIQANVREPVIFLMDNLDMGRNIVWATRQAGIKRLLNLGSSCMYPRGHSEPLKEEMILSGELEPTNEGYALSKVVTARLCEYITREDTSYQYKTLIPCNLFGRHDKFEPKFSHLLPAIIHKIHGAKSRGEQSVEIWGDGSARREFMYAGDLADVVLRAVEYFDTLPTYMNVGLGTDYSISEYYSMAAAVVGWTGSFDYDLTKPVGMKQKLVSVERQIKWGWRAKTSLREGIEATYDFYKRNLPNDQ